MIRPIQFGILTVSDRSSRGEREDLSGPALIKAVEQSSNEVLISGVVADDRALIVSTLIKWCDLPDLDVILTTGGTGFSSRDITPEATAEVIDRQVPGLAELMRAESYKINRHAMLSRATAGIKNHVLIINLPGSPKAADENFSIISGLLPHAVDLLRDSPSAEAGHLVSPGP